MSSALSDVLETCRPTRGHSRPLDPLAIRARNKTQRPGLFVFIATSTRVGRDARLLAYCSACSGQGGGSVGQLKGVHGEGKGRVDFSSQSIELAESNASTREMRSSVVAVE